MGCWVSGLALVLGLMMPAIVVAREARAVMQVGITITGKDAHATAGPKAAQKSVLQPATKPSAEK
jgi:hypothetical protein